MEGLPHPWQVRIKYGLDRIMAVLLLILMSPLFLVLSIGVLADDGRPIFFRQARPGLRAKIFRVWKFRTMVVNADRLLNEDGRPTGQRVTRFGRFLRASSFDELPNMFSIVAGRMSFVGPRPALVEHLDRYTNEQAMRFRMKPGVTGLAQVNGRNHLPWSDRIRYDNEYIDNYSLLLDLKIVLRTVLVVVRREGVSMDRNPELADDLRTDDRDESEAT